MLSWLTSRDVLAVGDQIEDVNRKMLDKILNEADAVAVYFYSDVCGSCREVLDGLETIDDQTDDIDLVKINDPRYARKYGVTKFPSLVYFRKKFPSIYRGKQEGGGCSTLPVQLSKYTVIQDLLSTRL